MGKKKVWSKIYNFTIYNFVLGCMQPAGRGIEGTLSARVFRLERKPWKKQSLSSDT